MKFRTTKTTTPWLLVTHLCLSQWIVGAILLTSPSAILSHSKLALSLIVFAATALWLWKPTRKYAWITILSASCLLVATQLFVLSDFPIQVPLVLGAITWFLTALHLFTFSHKGPATFAASLFLLTLLLTFVETIAPQFDARRLVITRGPVAPEVNSAGTEYDRRTFYTLRPGVRVENAKLSEKTVWEARYTIGDDASRIVPRQPETGPIWAFFGGSFTFGHGLNDADTIPALVQAENRQVRVYNFGINGSGPADAYFQLQKRLEEHLQMSVCVYSMIDWHIHRAGLPDWHLATKKGYLKKPMFEVTNGELIYRGKAGNAISRIRQFNIDLIRSSWIYRKLNSLFHHPRDSEVLITRSLIRAMQKKSRDHSCEFVVVRFPLYAPEKGTPYNGFYEKLRGDGIAVLDLHEKLVRHVNETDTDWSQYYLPGDGHPNAAGSRLFSRWILDALAHLAPPGKQ